MQVVGDFVTALSVLMASVDTVGTWIWLRPKMLFLLILAPVFALRPLYSRHAIDHGAPWLFAGASRYRIIEGILRHGSLVTVSAITALLIMALAGPAIHTQKHEPKENRPALAYVVDVSGSMDGILWKRLTGFLQEFTKAADRLLDEKRIGVGLYYFSSAPLLNVSPTPSYRMLRNVVRRFSTKSYGAGSGTEPAPSMWLSVLDMVRMGNASLVEPLQQSRKDMLFSCTVRGSGETAPDFTRQFIARHGIAVFEALRKATIGKRMVLGTDTEFDLTSYGDLCPWRLFRFAAAIGLPIDVVSTGAIVWQNEKDLPPLIANTGGKLYILSPSTMSGSNDSELSKEEYARIDVAVQAILGTLASSDIANQHRMYAIIDTVPQRFLLALAFVLFVLWMLLRLFRPIMGW